MGYQTDTLEQNKFVIKAIQFEDVTSGKVEVNKVFTGFKDVAGEIDWNYPDDFLLTSPQILVQSVGGYDTYYYVKNAWVDADTSVEGWANEWGVYVDLALTPGTAVWVKTPNGAAGSTASGAVATEVATVSVTKDKFTLLGNAFPVAVTLNGKQMTITGLEGGEVDFSNPDAFLLSSPQLLIQSAGGYDTYYYVKNAWVDADTSVEGWANEWGLYVSDIIIPAGRGFWLKAATDVTVAFNL